MRSWLARESLRTRRPNSAMGATTTGTISSTRAVSLKLVSASMIRLPIPSSVLRTAIDTLVPTTCSSSALSAVRREITSPVRACSKNAGDSSSRCANTSRRKSATTRSPSQDTR